MASPAQQYDPYDEEDSFLAAPPSSLQAEQAILGSALKHPAALDHITDQLLPADFYSPRNRHVYAAMCHMAQHGQAIDYHTLAEQLRTNGTYEAAGGMIYLSEIGLATPMAAHMEHYAGIVVEHSLMRQTIAAMQAGAEQAYRKATDADTILAEIEQRILTLRGRVPQQERITMESSMARYQQVMDDRAARHAAWQASQDGAPLLVGHSCGHVDIDRMLLGFWAKTYILLGARTGKGKSQLQIQWAVHMAEQALRQGPSAGVVVMFSLEMAEVQLNDRAVAMRARISREDLGTNALSPEQRLRYETTRDHLTGLPLLWRTEQRTTHAIRAELRRIRDEYGRVRAVFVDYVQLLEDVKAANGRSARHEDLGIASGNLAKLAKEYDCPVIASAQLNRTLDARRNPIPRLSDFRDSGNLEQDAEIVLALVRNNPYSQDADADDDNATEIVGEAPGVGRVYKLKDRNLSDSRNRPNMARLVWVEEGEFYANYQAGPRHTSAVQQALNDSANRAQVRQGHSEPAPTPPAAAPAGPVDLPW